MKEIFDNTSPSWRNELEYNLVFLSSQQSFANELLKRRGHIFLNEIYDMLGMQRSSAGAITGWLLDEDNKTFVDFGLKESDGHLLLDFNVDGIIYDKI